MKIFLSSCPQTDDEKRDSGTIRSSRKVLFLFPIHSIKHKTIHERFYDFMILKTGKLGA